MLNQTENANLKFDAATESKIISRGLDVLATEVKALQDTAEQIGKSFVKAVKMIMECRGRLCITGMGKAGLVGHKIQATFASTGTLSYCLHPGEAMHGDMGMVHGDDVILALSKSGSSEVAAILPTLKNLGCEVILITSKKGSAAGVNADCELFIPETEACSLGLAPSSSTTAMIALGDALALTVMDLRDFKVENYARNHPGGALGRSLMHVEDIMRTDANCPEIVESSTFAECFEAISKAPMRAGAAVVVDDARLLKGIVTMGDLFRFVAKNSDPKHGLVRDMMTVNPKRVEVGKLVLEATKIMRRYMIDEIPVVDSTGRIAGLIDVQDLIAEGFDVI